MTDDQKIQNNESPVQKECYEKCQQHSYIWNSYQFSKSKYKYDKDVQ